MSEPHQQKPNEGNTREEEDNDWREEYAQLFLGPVFKIGPASGVVKQ